MPVTDWGKPTTATSATWLPYDSTLVADIYTNDVVLPDYSWDVPHAYLPAPWSAGQIIIIGNFETSVGVPLALPANAVVDGIEVIMTASAFGGGGIVMCDPPDEFGTTTCYYPAIAAIPSKNGTDSVGTERQYNLNFSNLNFMLGGATDLWGTTWTDVEAEGIYFKVYADGDETPASGRRLDYFHARIWYHDGTAPPPVPGALAESQTKYLPGISVKGSPSSIRR